MKRIAVITTHTANNYGAVLQSCALVKAVNKLLGSDVCELLDYKAPYFEKLYHRKIRIKDILKRSNFLRRKRRDAATEKAYAQFRKEHMRISEVEYKNEKTLKDANKRYDIFIAGSDQIWNPANTTGDIETFDKTYLLNFVAEAHKKHSYASSIGLSVVPLALQEVYRKYLTSFNTLSVREHTGADILSGILQREVSAVVDPVLLLTPEEWQAVEKSVEDHPEKYVLAYNVHGGTHLQQIAEEKAQELNLPLYFIQPPVVENVAKDSTGTTLCGIGPSEFVWLFRNATEVVTSSFHGSAFSLLFSKKVHVFLDNPNSQKQRNSRIESLLKYFGITEEQLSIGQQEMCIMPDQRQLKAIQLSRRFSLDKLQEIIS